jgi:uracil-DNA glycosylase
MESLHYWNVAHYPTPGNRPLKMLEIKQALAALEKKIDEICPDKIVTLGKTAEIALSLLKREHHAMPHPSGRNRLLNDPKYVEAKIEGLKTYCSS